MHALWERTVENDIWADEQTLVQKWSYKERCFEVVGEINGKTEYVPT